MHIELTEMLRCPEKHQEEFLVLSTVEMSGRMVATGLLGCPVCHKEYEIVQGVVEFGGISTHHAPPFSTADPLTVQALLDLSGPGGYVVLVGSAVRYAVGLAALMGGVHFVGINPPLDAEELPILSLLRSEHTIPLRSSIARGVVMGAEVGTSKWLGEAKRILLKGRRLVIESEQVPEIAGVSRLAAGQGLWVGEKLDG
ncbi:MAG TPA: hypothetical protein VH163_04195 [Gemmatimonadales bacterium]|nr:hypothetical protein [Gemmatimonadales bacterium]